MKLSEIDIFSQSPFCSVRNVGYYKQKSGWVWESNCDYACFYCVSDGSLTLEFNNEKRTAYAGDVVFLRSADRGAILKTDVEDVSYYFISFYYDESVSLDISLVTNNASATTLFKDVNRAYHSEAYLYKLKVAQLFLEIVHHIATVTAMNTKSYLRASGLRAATEYVNVYYYKKITINDLCTVSNYSPAHLRRLFLKNYEVTPQEYIINKKLNAVREMLTDAPEKSIDEIADLLSFCSASYLCKLFKKHYGVSILQYKKTHGL
jgi:AraC-like DNA-binding protein